MLGELPPEPEEPGSPPVPEAARRETPAAMEDRRPAVSAERRPDSFRSTASAPPEVFRKVCRPVFISERLFMPSEMRLAERPESAGVSGAGLPEGVPPEGLPGELPEEGPKK